jgi:acyl carrier protein
VGGRSRRLLLRSEVGLQHVFDSVFRRRDIPLRPELTAANVPEWDSFRYVSLIVATEEFFGIKFLGLEIDELKNIGDLAQLVALYTRGNAK